MASIASMPRILARSSLLSRPSLVSRRLLSTTVPRQAEPIVAVTPPPPPPPPRKPIGAFRGSLFGFLLGSTLAAYGTYYYILEEYRVSNELLTEDIYSLQAAVQRIHTYVSSLEAKIETLEKKR